MNDDHKGGLQTALVLLQCQDECNVSLKSISDTTHTHKGIIKLVKSSVFNICQNFVLVVLKKSQPQAPR